jgi:hypothetical protein
MEGERRGQAVLPGLDLFVLQPRLPGGELPPHYSARDEFACMRVFFCDVCGTRLPDPDQLVQHVQVRLEQYCFFFYP